MKELIRKLLKENLLNEKSINDFSFENFNIKGIAHDWLMSAPSTVVAIYKYEMQTDYYMSSEDIDALMDTDEDEILENEDFKSWLYNHVEFKIEEAIDEISYLIKDGELTIWRVMTVDDEWLNNLPKTGKRLGKYWSFDKNSADAHWGGNHNNTIRIQTTVPEEYIDWTETIHANIDPNIGEMEKEITLFKNTPLYIDNLEVNGEVVNISNIKNKEFKA